MIKKTLFLISAILFSLETFCDQNGLYFHSHSYQTSQRTTLHLNNREAIRLGDVTTMSFFMDLRKEDLFGNIFCIKTNNGHHIDASLSISDDNIGRPSLVVDGKFYYIHKHVTPEKNVNVSIQLDCKKGVILFCYGKDKITINADIKNSDYATILFGMHTDESNYYDVAPMVIRDITINRDGKDKYLWKLSNHFDSICIDDISKEKAIADNGQWLYDSHVKWSQRFSYQSKHWMQVAFNPDNDNFYILEDQKVHCFNPETNKTSEVEMKGGNRLMSSSNYIFYDNTDGTIFSYALSHGLSSKFDFNTGLWSNNSNTTFEPSHGNHAWARLNDSISYAFGGYGYYRYKNDLYKINQRTGKITLINYSPKIQPRTGCAAAIADGKMYIFGGYGNESGKQEVPGKYFFDLICIDLHTLKATTLWTAKGEQNTSFQLAAEMMYDKEKKCFYAATSHQGGRIIRISLDKPKWEIVTDEMNVRFEFREMTFNLFKSDKTNKLYVVTNRYISDNKHELAIFSIDRPLQDNYLTELEKWQDTEKKSSNHWLWLLLLVPILGCYNVYYMRRKKNAPDNGATEDRQASFSDNVLENITESGNDDYEEPAPAEETLHPGTITILGKFAITDRKGNDITSNFSKRLRDLLLIIILHTQKNSKGIEMKEIDDNIWQNMTEVSARNNRNVNISKLRLLLEKVGDVEISNDKTYYKIKIGNDVSCDYMKAMKYMAKVNDGYKDEKTIARTLELLLKGPLVPNVSYEWLDSFKAKYSESALALLNSLLYRAEQDKNDKLALKIAETIMQHDPFNDKSLAVQCAIHCRHNRKGVAKKVYDNFCRIYQNSIGEEYNKSFMEVCK